MNPMPDTPPSSDAGRLLRVQLFLLVLLVGGLAGNIWLLLSTQDAPSLDAGPLNDTGAKPRATQLGLGPTSNEERTIAAYERTHRAVVGISVGNLATTRRKGQRVPIQITRGAGSGIVWDAGGWIVTNWHVVSEGAQIQVSLGNDEIRDATIVGASEQHDLAVIKINPQGLDLVPMAIGSSQDLKVGQSVLALGSPFRLERSLSMGIISGLDRSIHTTTRHEISGAIQTDAAINPGNSGGALLDLSGRLIGINTAIHSATNENNGVGFAIPIDLVNSIVPRIIAGEMPVDQGRAVLGILMLDPHLAPNDGLGGVIIDAVIPGGGADQAGLKSWVDLPGGGFTFDRIVGLDSEPITSQEDLLKALAQHRAGETVVVTYQREGKGEQETTVTLGSTR